MIPKHYMFAFSGYSGVGKDECVKPLVEKHNAIHIGLADVAKRHVMDLYQFTVDQMFGPSENRNKLDSRYGLTPRHILQEYMRIMQDMYSYTWIDKGLSIAMDIADVDIFKDDYVFKYSYSKIVGLISSQENICYPISSPVITVFSDFRHWHDIKRPLVFKSDKFIPVLIRIKRPSIQKPPFDHRSEIEQSTIPDSEFNFIIDNNFDVPCLHYQVEKVVSYVFGFGVPEQTINSNSIE
jgi:hypothetical protein